MAHFSAAPQARPLRPRSRYPRVSRFRSFKRSRHDGLSTRNPRPRAKLPGQYVPRGPACTDQALASSTWIATQRICADGRIRWPSVRRTTFHRQIVFRFTERLPRSLHRHTLRLFVEGVFPFCAALPKVQEVTLAVREKGKEELPSYRDPPLRTPRRYSSSKKINPSLKICAKAEFPSLSRP